MTRREVLRLATGLLAVGAAQPLPALAQPQPPAGSVLTPGTRGSGQSRLAPASAAPGVTHELAPHPDAPLSDLLRLLPDSPENRRLVPLNDLALAAERTGIQRPSVGADQTAMLAYMMALADAGIAKGPFVGGLDPYPEQGFARRDYLAFGVENVRQSGLVGEPPYLTELIVGQFDPAATDAALARCTECVPPNRETYQNVPFYAWGEDLLPDFDGIFKPPAYDEFGRGGRIAVQPTLVYRTVWTEGMHTAIDTGLGSAPSLADVPGFMALARGVVDLGAYSLILSNDTSMQAGSTATLDAMLANVQQDEAREEQARRAADPSLLLRPYGAIAFGTGLDENGRYLALGLLHLTEQDAARNAEIIPRRIEEVPSTSQKRPWRELFGDVETHTDGRLLFARLRQRDGTSNLWQAWWYSRDTLLYFGV
jgi:hypothetical protein